MSILKICKAINYLLAVFYKYSIEREFNFTFQLFIMLCHLMSMLDSWQEEKQEIGIGLLWTSNQNFKQKENVSCFSSSLRGAHEYIDYYCVHLCNLASGDWTVSTLRNGKGRISSTIIPLFANESSKFAQITSSYSGSKQH